MTFKLPLSLLLLFASLSFSAVACGSEQDLDAPPITASVLIEPEEGGGTWFKDVSVPKGTDGYELLKAAVDGNLVAEWYSEYPAHFVSSVLGVGPVGSEFWAVFIWNEDSLAWEPLPVGADLFSVKEGHIMGWALVEYNTESPELPTSIP